MGEERVTRLRAVVVGAITDADMVETDYIGGIPSGLDWDRGVDDHSPVVKVLRAIVETLGIGDEAEHGVVIAADALEMLAGRKQTALAIRQRELVGESRKAALALRTLLAAAHGGTDGE